MAGAGGKWGAKPQCCSLNNAAVVWVEHKPVFLFKLKCEPAVEVLESCGAFGPCWEVSVASVFRGAAEGSGCRLRVSCAINSSHTVAREVFLFLLHLQSNSCSSAGNTLYSPGVAKGEQRAHPTVPSKPELRES